MSVFDIIHNKILHNKFRPRPLIIIASRTSCKSKRWNACPRAGRVPALQLQAAACSCKHFNSYIAGIDIRRQILTSKVDPRTVRVKIFIMAVDP